MTNRHTAARWAAFAVLSAALCACATAQRPDPMPIVDDVRPDAVTLSPEFHGARVGHDHLRGELPSE